MHLGCAFGGGVTAPLQRPQVAAHHPASAIHFVPQAPHFFFCAQVLPSAAGKGGRADRNDNP